MQTHENLILVIAGNPVSASLRNEINGEAITEPRVWLKLEYVLTEDIQLYFRASDFIILPCEEISNSGIDLLFLSFDKQILAPRMGSLGKLQRCGGER